MKARLTKDTPARRAELAAGVDAERDRRASLGFVFAGRIYQARQQDLTNINGAATAASLAMLAGAAAGDLRWADPDADFVWIGRDNAIAPMDAPTVIAFARAAMAHVTRLVMAGRALKDRVSAGEVVDPAGAPEWPATPQEA